MNGPLEYTGFQCWLWIPGNSREWIRNLRAVIQVLYKHMVHRLNDVKAKAGATWKKPEEHYKMKRYNGREFILFFFFSLVV